jgi:hypothetical protein
MTKKNEFDRGLTARGLMLGESGEDQVAKQVPLQLQTDS